jgi:hypothetical protein
MVLLRNEALVELCSVRLKIVLILTQDRCTVCTERTIGSYIVLDAPDGTLSHVVVWNLVVVRLETVSVSVQDRYTVCKKYTIGIEIIFDTLDGTPR